MILDGLSTEADKASNGVARIENTRAKIAVVQRRGASARPKCLRVKAKLFKCTFCKKGYCNQNTLWNHAVVHRSDYCCSWCLREFTEKAEFDEHKKICHKRLYECYLCKKLWKDYTTLESHMRVHSGVKPFRCSFAKCGKSFKRKDNLRKHELVVHMIIASTRCHECYLCKKLCPSPSELRTHMRVHTGERPFRCSIKSCGASFSLKSSLTTHIKSKHKIAK